jgi:hypothetical protein
MSNTMQDLAIKYLCHECQAWLDHVLFRNEHVV